MELQRTITFKPAYDKTDPDPSKNCGIHGVELRMLLTGEHGVVQFLLYTNWHLPHVQRRLDMQLDGDFSHLFCHPMPADLGYHSPVPMYEDHKEMENCSLLEHCYYDGSSLVADDVYQILLNKGCTGVWAELEKYYHNMFGEAI